MRNILRSVLFATMVLGFASTATAGDGYSGTVVTKVTTRYILQDLGIVASNKPGIVTDIAITKGPWTLDWWQRVDLAGGTYGNRGYGDEHDFTLTGDWKLGSFCLEASASYYMLAPLKGTDSDGIEFYLDVGRPFELGHEISVTPAIRLIDFVGFKDFPNIAQVRLRMPITIPVPGTTSVFLILDPSMDQGINHYVGQHDFVFRPTASVLWQVNKDLTLQVDAKGTNHTPVEVDLGLAYHFN